MFYIRRGHPAHLVEDISRESAGGGNPEDAEHYDEQSVIVQLSARVQDGTRCRSGSLDMCIQGKCQVSAIWLNFWGTWGAGPLGLVGLLRWAKQTLHKTGDGGFPAQIPSGSVWPFHFNCFPSGLRVAIW